MRVRHQHGDGEWSSNMRRINCDRVIPFGRGTSRSHVPLLFDAQFLWSRPMTFLEEQVLQLLTSSGGTRPPPGHRAPRSPRAPRGACGTNST